MDEPPIQDARGALPPSIPPSIFTLAVYRLEIEVPGGLGDARYDEITDAAWAIFNAQAATFKRALKKKFRSITDLNVLW